MSYIEAVVLAIIQGLTEFLPVSSSGHLVLAQHWFGKFNETNLLYDIMLHLATVMAIMVYFRQDLTTLVLGFFGYPTNGQSIFAGEERKTLGFVILASIPTAVLGLIIEQIGIQVLGRPDLVGGLFILTGMVLWMGRGGQAGRGMKDMTPIDAITVGVVQGIAVFPGISRSGATIAGGLWLGLDRELAARFSLLISIPAILGATLLEVVKAFGQAQPPMAPFIVGMFVAAVVGYLSISLILRLVRQDHFYRFSYYLWPLGTTVLLLTYW
ncbi:MAG: undecaprenyl-diphosphate phosphatase [Nitrospirota bacterium]|nr:MAG: undecaprenyl-diphosphate phosphatase [Nitrospirota bacterium]